VRCRPKCRTLYAAADESIVWPSEVTAVQVDGGLHAVLLGAVLAGAATPVGKSAHAVLLFFMCADCILC